MCSRYGVRFLSLAFGPKGAKAYVAGCASGDLYVYNWSTNALLYNFKAHDAAVCAVVAIDTSPPGLEPSANSPL